MDALRRTLSNVTKQMRTLTGAHMLLLGAVCVILVLTLVVVAQLSSKATYVELLPGTTPADMQAQMDRLAMVGMQYKPQNGKLMVRTEDWPRAKGLIAESGLLPANKALLFETLLDKQSWTNSRQQNEQNYLMALQNELAFTIENFTGVKTAKVLIDIPSTAGLGVAVRKPTASAVVMTDTGQPLAQSMVDAIAAFISGSRAGLDITRVRVIDGATGRQRKPTSEEEILPSTYLEHAAKVEMQTREKVQELLVYIPGVVVAVTAQVDVKRSTAQVTTHMNKGDGTVSLVSKETSTETRSTEGSGAAEPGVGANQTADINRGNGGGGGGTSSIETLTESENRVGTRSETIVDPKGFPTFVAVSVNVPRGWVAGLMKDAAGAAAPAGGAATPAAPDEAAIRKKFEEELRPSIVASLRPQVRALTAQANQGATAEQIDRMLEESIGVALIPMDMPAIPAAQSAGILGSLTGGGSSGGGVLSLGGGLVEKGVLLALAVVAMGMMLMMVKKAAVPTAGPSAEELVGVPPTLDSDADVIGEAEEGDTAMAGIEVGESEIATQKMLEQVGDLVGKDPQAAARLLSRWIEVEE